MLAGADVVEVDVELTRDGQLVLLHDTTLERLWGVPAAVSTLTLAEVATRTGGGPWAVPTLAHALALARHQRTTLMVDIPAPSEGAAVVELVGAHDAWDLVVLAGDPETLATARRDAPHARIALSWEQPELPQVSLLDRVRPECVNQLHRLLDADAVQRVHDGGMTVCAYTVDTEARMRQLVAMGVDAIISNDIRLLRRTLAGAPARAV